MGSAATARVDNAAPATPEGPAASAAAGPPAHLRALRAKAQDVGSRILSLPTRAKDPHWIHTSWAWVQPATTVKAAWRMSWVVDDRRIPGDSPLLGFLWWLSNCLDRPFLFLLVMITPTGLDRPVRWCATRPDRRFAAYGLLLAVTAARTGLLWCAQRPTRRIGLYVVWLTLAVVRNAGG
jgi:hypothetical protein